MSTSSLVLRRSRSRCRLEPVECATLDHLTAFLDAAVKLDEHSRRVLVLLDCSPVGSDLRTRRDRRVDARERHDVVDEEEPRHERAIRQRDATAAGEATGADEAVERRDVPRDLAGELVAETIVARGGVRLAGQGARL